MEHIDLESESARKVLTLNKRDVCKRLQVAVRDTQGGARACWAPSERPEWWLQDFKVTLPDGKTVKSLQFASQSKQYWAVERARVTLLLFEFQEALGEKAVEEPPALSSPQLVPLQELDVEPKPVAEKSPSADISNKTVVDVTGNDPKQMETEENEAPSDGSVPISDVQPSDEGSSEENQKLQAQIDAIRERMKVELAAWEEGAKKLREDLIYRSRAEVNSFKMEFQMYRMKNFPRKIQEMPMGDYVREYGADAMSFLLKQVENCTHSVHNDATLDNDETECTTPVASHTKARRDAVTATVRKASRAARARQQESTAAPTTAITRRRPVRQSARQAADRNKILLSRRPNAAEELSNAGDRSIESSQSFEPQTPQAPPRSLQSAREARHAALATVQQLQGEKKMEYLRRMKADASHAAMKKKEEAAKAAEEELFWDDLLSKNK